MGEVLCATKGEEKKLTEWVDEKPDRYLVWMGEKALKAHARIFTPQDHELSYQQIAAQLIYLPFVYDDPSHPALQRLAKVQMEVHYRASDYADQGAQILTNFRSNLQQPTFLAASCFGKFAHCPAIVCGAGPSLKEIIPFLKQHRDKFLILGCGAGMQALLSARIEPHLVVHVDADPYHKFSKNSIPLFYQLRTSHEVVSQMKGPRFLMAGSGEFALERYIEEKLGLEPSTDGGWTAVTRGAALAVELGCKNIYFAGVDFSASSGAMYAEGVAPPKDTSGTRPDWALAAEWLSRFTAEHPEQTWGLFSKPNPLMPSIPAAKIEECIGHEAVSFSITGSPVCGKEIWNEIGASFAKCRTLIDQFMARFQTVFPNPPLGDEACVKILNEIDQELAVQKVLDPIWSYWEVVLKRQPQNDSNSLAIHRTLFLKTLADRFYA
ncbi:MAG: 6-hydroxymethylpterin diphosphokinase MptE-like protein [Rhabdochlamydiaceae bacterium]